METGVGYEVSQFQEMNHPMRFLNKDSSDLELSEQTHPKDV